MQPSPPRSGREYPSFRLRYRLPAANLVLFLLIFGIPEFGLAGAAMLSTNLTIEHVGEALYFAEDKQVKK